MNSWYYTPNHTEDGLYKITCISYACHMQTIKCHTLCAFSKPSCLANMYVCMLMYQY